ncbi:hypothetical protein NE236_32675 [Actinoallomurus purpureus]|uniref:hypothetical protein n=1 Tax=Actinoallomurus purpureus TaxID=478114 RepID=UPI002092CF2E|nr:hypothetical protein [Actinoallomurus purpureus]MCO6009736.1 hypothetical protein [Actinoallomurus purpureus]
MSSIVGTIATAAATAVATTWAIGMTVSPRLDARKARILKAHQDRDSFSDSILTILAACARLEAFEIPSDVPDTLGTALRAERQRWLNQIDEATCWLVDNTQRWAGTYYSGWGLRDLMVRYAADARGVVLSERDEAAKVSFLREITEPVQEIFFARTWWLRALRVASQAQRLTCALDRLESGETSDMPTPGTRDTAQAQ